MPSWTAEHHFRNLQRSRDALTESILALKSAAERMTGDDWIEARSLLVTLEQSIAPRLAELRTNASDRFDEHTRRPDFEAMRVGELGFPDERPAQSPLRDPHWSDQSPMSIANVPALPSANAHEGAKLVAKHGGLDAAKAAYQPDSQEFDHLQAYVYMTTGRRPKHWVPPTWSPEENDA